MRVTLCLATGVLRNHSPVFSESSLTEELVQAHNVRVHFTFASTESTNGVSLMNDARASFIRLAEARTQKLLKDLELLGNLSNRSNYSYSEDDVKVIFKAITKKMQDTELRFKVSLSRSKKAKFELPK
jgi:hypothetical protein